MEAFAAFFHSLSKKAQVKYYTLIPEVLNILPPLKQANQEQDLSKAFISLIELAEAAPKMFKTQFSVLRQFSISVIQDTSLDNQTRQNALELMATFAEWAPNMCKKDPEFASSMVTQCLSLMTDLGDEDDDLTEWNEREDLDAEESDLNHVTGEQCMDRLANKLGGEVLLPVTFTWLPRMMHSSSWRDRHAALMAISAISEGCRDLMLNELDKVLELVIPSLKDPHPRVRFAACNAIGQMSTDFAGTMQEKYHQVVLSSIVPVLESPEPRVQAHAAAALVNFCEEAEKATLEPYLDALLNHLLVLLNSPKRYVQEQALSTIATIADSAETAFVRFYDTLMPQLLNLLRGQQDKEYRLLRAKAMECATLIALAVGKDKMGSQALDLVQTLGSIQQGITDPDDPQSQYLLHCWGRMCRVLGMDFLPFLSAVMPPLLALASAKADIQLLENDEDIDQDEGWELVPLKGKVIGIKTQTLEDKNTAIELITIYAQILEKEFASYVQDIMSKIALPGLAFFFHDPVRVSSAKLIPALLNSYKKAYGPTSTQLGQLWTEVVEKEIEILVAEPAIETLAEMYQCFYESVEVVGKNCLSPHYMSRFIASAESTLEEYEKRVQARDAERADAATQGAEDEDDSMSMQYAIEDDQTLLSDMNKAFHTIFKNMGSAFLPAWEKLLPYYQRFITSKDATQRQWAICIVDDVLEFCGAQSWSYHNLILEPLYKGLQDENAANRQAAAYGVGMAAQKGGEPWAEFVAGCIEPLFSMTRLPNARSEDDVFATENACSAIAKILHFSPSKVPSPAAAIIAPWLDTLPIVNDEEAAPYAYSFVAQLIDQGNETVRAKAEQVFHAICLALEAETIQGQTAKKVAESAKTLVQTSGVDANRVLQSLSPDGQGTVRAFFT